MLWQLTLNDFVSNSAMQQPALEDPSAAPEDLPAAAEATTCSKSCASSTSSSSTSSGSSSNSDQEDAKSPKPEHRPEAPKPKAKGKAKGKAKSKAKAKIAKVEEEESDCERPVPDLPVAVGRLTTPSQMGRRLRRTRLMLRKVSWLSSARKVLYACKLMSPQPRY